MLNTPLCYPTLPETFKPCINTHPNMTSRKPSSIFQWLIFVNDKEEKSRILNIYLNELINKSNIKAQVIITSSTIKNNVNNPLSLFCVGPLKENNKLKEKKKGTKRQILFPTSCCRLDINPGSEVLAHHTQQQGRKGVTHPWPIVHPFEKRQGSRSVAGITEKESLQKPFAKKSP